MNSSALPDTAETLRLLVDHVPSMLAYWGADLRCRFANHAYVRWFGVDPDALVGTSIRDLLGPKLFALNEPYIRAALNGQEQTFERVVPGPDGVKRHSLATYVPDIQNGHVRGFIAHVTEVTRLKNTEEALRTEVAERERANARLSASESALREAQRLGQVGSWEWDVASDATTWSHELYVMFGLDPTRPPPNYADQPALFAPGSWAVVQSAVAHTLATGAPYTLELQYHRPDGNPGWLEARGEAVRAGDHHTVVKLRGTVHEITQRHLMDEVRLALQAADAANRNKTALMSRVSHELRTPLNAILGFSQLCQAEASLSPKHRQWADLIVSSGQHMLEIVNEMLDLAAAEAGQLSVQHVEVEMGALLKASLLHAAATAQRAGVVLANRTGPGPVTAWGDPVRLKQVVDNLLSNAIKYTGAGGGVTVSASLFGDAVELRFDDTGIGLTDAQISRLFMPFDRLGAERTAVAGTGLGLALTKQLIELMGGNISVSSRAGQGSSFVVTLPGWRD